MCDLVRGPRDLTHRYIEAPRPGVSDNQAQSRNQDSWMAFRLHRGSGHWLPVCGENRVHRLSPKLTDVTSFVGNSAPLEAKLSRGCPGSQTTSTNRIPSDGDTFGSDAERSRKVERKWKERYNQKFRRRAVARMNACDNIVRLSRELGLNRSLLYKWRYQLEPPDAQVEGGCRHRIPANPDFAE